MAPYHATSGKAKPTKRGGKPKKKRKKKMMKKGR